MNYWLLTSEFPPIHGGGISTYCWHTAKMLATKNHVVTVFTQDFSVANFKIENPFDNCRLIRFNPNRNSSTSSLGYEARLSLEFSNLLQEFISKEGKPDYIETQDYMGIGYYTLQKKQLLYPEFQNIPIVLTIHAPGFLYLEYNQAPQYNFPEFWYGQMEKSSIRSADILLSPSNYILEELETRMDLNELTPKRIFNPFVPLGEAQLEYNEYDIAFFGKLTPQKGCIEMFSYFAKMWDNGFTYPLRVIGGGKHFFYPQQQDMIEYIKKKYSKYIDQKKIIFEGNLPPEKLKHRLAKAHVIITPSIVDNLPYAVLEAMSIGKVVLASENGGHKEILKHESSGFIFSHELENDFSKQLEKILLLDTNQIHEIGKKAIQAVINSTNYNTVYEEKTSILSQYEESNSKHFSYTLSHNTASIKADKNEELLSVVVPFYNLGEFIHDCIKSIFNSSHKNLEVIIINDGSINESDIEQLNAIKNSFPKVKIENKKNEGLSLARNYGAKIASGRFLAFLDADDTVEPQYYKKAIEILKHYNNVHFVGCWAQYFGESNRVWPTFNPEPPYVCVHNMINSSALVYERQSFLNFGKNDKKLIYGMEDYDSVLSMLENNAWGVSLPETFWNYRIRNNSMQQSFNRNKELYLYRLISDKHKDFFSNYTNEISNLLNHNGPGINYDNPTINQSNGVRIPEFNSKFMYAIKKVPLLRKIGKKLYQKLLN